MTAGRCDGLVRQLAGGDAIELVLRDEDPRLLPAGGR